MTAAHGRQGPQARVEKGPHPGEGHGDRGQEGRQQDASQRTGDRPVDPEGGRAPERDERRQCRHRDTHQSPESVLHRQPPYRMLQEDWVVTARENSTRVPGTRSPLAAGPRWVDHRAGPQGAGPTQCSQTINGGWNGHDDTPHRAAKARLDHVGGDGASGRQRLCPGAGSGALCHHRRRHRTRRPRVPPAVAERGAGSGRQRGRGQAEDHRLPRPRRPGDRRGGRRLPRRRLPGGGRGPRGQADRRVAELARRERLRPPVPPRRALPPPGAAPGRTEGDPHGPQPGEGVGDRPEADRDPRLLRGRAPGLHRGDALRRRPARRGRSRRAREARGRTSRCCATP